MFHDLHNNQATRKELVRIMCEMFSGFIQGRNGVRVSFPQSTIDRLKQSVNEAPVTFLTGYYKSGKSTLSKELNGGATPIFESRQTRDLPYSGICPELEWLLARLEHPGPITSCPQVRHEIEQKLTQQPRVYVFDQLTYNEQTWLVELIDKHLDWLKTLPNGHLLFIYPLLPNGINSRLASFGLPLVTTVWGPSSIYQLFEHLTRDALRGYFHPDTDLPLEELIADLDHRGLLPRQYQNQTVKDLIEQFNYHPIYGPAYFTGHYNIEKTAQEFLQMFRSL